MANYTTADVKRLRELTAAGMMDCKKALDETDGDFDKAVEILRIKGAKDVGKRAERTTANGLVGAATQDTRTNAGMVKTVADDLGQVAARIRAQVDEFFDRLIA